MGPHVDYMMTGAIAAAYAAAGLFFFRFWRDTRDRLFLFFGVALFVLAANRTVFAVFDPAEIYHHQQYWVRFVAFAAILVAIIDKNRTRSPSG